MARKSRGNKRKPRYIFPAERERMYKCQTNERYEKRNIALCRIGFTNGFRIGEITNLQFNNFFDEKWELLRYCGLRAEQTKGNYGERHFFNVVESTRQAILDYVEERREVAKSFGKILQLNEPMFCSQKGGKYKDTPFKPESLMKLFCIMATMANVTENSNGPVSSHSMRRSFATDIFETCKNPKVLQVLLGHTSPIMSQEYMSTHPHTLSDIVADTFK